MLLPLFSRFSTVSLQEHVTHGRGFTVNEYDRRSRLYLLVDSHRRLRDTDNLLLDLDLESTTSFRKSKPRDFRDKKNLSALYIGKHVVSTELLT